MKTKKAGMKGQSQMLEYVLLMVFVVAVILMLMLFLTWWQLSQLKVEESKGQQGKALSMLNLMLDSPYLAKENSMLDDGKLTVLSSIIDGCDELKKVYGEGWHAEVMLLDGKPRSKCTQASYPECNYWSICPEQQSEGRISRVIPVNVYRNIGFVLNVTNEALPRVYLATLNVTVYV